MGNVAKRELKRILAFFVAVCMWHTAVLPWNISYADTTPVVAGESNKSNESKHSTVVPMTVTVEGPSKSETPSGSTPSGTTGETASSSTPSGTTGGTASSLTPSGTTGETASSSTPGGTTGGTASSLTPSGTTGETASSSTPGGTTGGTASSSTAVGTTGETPSEPTVGETPSEPTIGETPSEPTVGETPSEPTIGETPSEPTVGETPSEPTIGETPSEPTVGETPSEPTEGETPSEPTAGETPSEPTEGETPSEPTAGETPSEPTEGETPSEPTAGETLSEPTEGENPSEPTAGETPSEPTVGEIPSEPTVGETPSEPTEGETPSELTAGETPSEPTVGEIPSEPTVGEIPSEPTVGEIPSEPTVGEIPSEPTVGETPSEPTVGETPSEPTEGETPSEPTAGETPSEPTVGETPSEPLAGEISSESITGSATGETINGALEENMVGSYFSTLNTSLGSDIPNVIDLNSEAEVEPSLTFVSASSNSDTNYVKEGNVITFVVTAIGIVGKPSISLGNVPVSEENIVLTGENTYQATLTLPNSLSNGNIRYEVNANDESGETYSISGNLTIIFDKVAPSTPVAGTVRLKKEIGSKIAYSKIEVNDTNGVKSVKLAKDLSDDETTWGEVQWQDIVVSSESESQFVSGVVGKQEFDIVLNEIGIYTLLVVDMAGNETIGKNIITVADGDPMLVIGNLPKTEYVVNSEQSIDLTGGTLRYGTTFTDAITVDMTDSENVSCKTSTDILTTTGNNKPVILSYRGSTCTFSINVVAGKKYITFASDEMLKIPATTFSERITYSPDEIGELYYVWSNNKDITGEEEVYTPSNGYGNRAPFSFSGKIEQADNSNTLDAWYFDNENGMFRSPNNKISADGGTSYETITITPINDQDGKARIAFDYKTDSRTIHEMIISINGKEVGRTSGKPDWISYVGEHTADEDGKYVVELKYVKDSTIGTTEDYAAIRNLKFYDDKVWNSLDATKGSANLNLESVLGYRNYLHVKGESKDGIPFHEVSTEFYGDVTLQGVAIYKVPNQTLYNLNSNLNTEGGELTLFFDKGTEIISLDDISKNENIALPEFDSSTPGIKEIKIIYEHTDGAQFTAYYTVLVEEKRTTDIVNSPEYLDGMVPVKWYESTDNSESYWVVTTWEDSEWYDYDFSEKRWANVMLRDGLEVRQVDDPMSASIAEMAGKRVISEGSMFVWIPRFTYAVTDSYETSGIVSIRWSNGVIDDQSDDFLIHPAFRNVAYRGGDPNSASSYVSDPTQNELSGFWMAKFESSYNDDNLLQIKADQIPVYGETFISALEDSQNMISVNYSNYGISDDAYSRLTKNSEWGAVAFLSVGNTSNQYAEDNEPYVNNVIFNSKTRTGYSSETGNDSGVSDPAKIGTTVFRYNTAEGVNASTTKNIYGIYDMVGGVREYVASFYPSDDVVATVESFASDYETSADFDVIDIDADLYNYKGFAITDMIYEEAELYVEDGLWNYDIVNHIEERDIITRGGVYKDQEGAGLFNMVTVSPDPATDKDTDKEDALYTGFRPTILVGEQKETKINISNVKIYSSNSSNNQYAKAGDTITIEFTASDMVYVTDAKVGTGTTLVSIAYDQSKTAKNWSLTYTVKESDSGRVKFEISYKGQTNESDTGTVPEPTNFSVLVDNKVNGGIEGSEGGSGGSEDGSGGIISTRPSGNGIEIDVDNKTGEDEAPIKIILWQKNEDKELTAKDDFYDENGELIVSDEAGNIIGGDITANSGFTVTDPGIYWIFIEDEAGNQSITKILINDDELDKKPPTVEDVKIYVNDVLVNNIGFAKKNDIIKLEMTFSEELNRAPDVTILESPYSADDITKQGNKYLLYHTATLDRNYDELPFSIVNYQDKSSNTATEPTTNPASNGNVIYDVDLVEVEISVPVDISSDEKKNYQYTVSFSDKYLETDDINFTVDDIEVLKVGANSNIEVENILIGDTEDPAVKTVTFMNITGGGMFGLKVKGATKTRPAPRIFVHDKAGNANWETSTSFEDGNMGTADTEAPEILEIQVYSNNELNNQYAKNGHIITVEFNTNEKLQGSPTVMMNERLMNVEQGDDENAWKATYQISEDEETLSEGRLNFVISGVSDIAGNVASDVAVNKVVYDRTNPYIGVDPNGGNFRDTAVAIILSDNMSGIADTEVRYCWSVNGIISESMDWETIELVDGRATVWSPVELNSSRYLIIDSVTDRSGNVSEQFVSAEYIFKNQYRITATAQTNGTITPSGNSYVSANKDITYTITPNTGYVVDKVYIDGVALATPVTEYTFTKVTENHTILVTFVPGKNYKVATGVTDGIIVEGLQNAGNIIGITTSTTSDAEFIKTETQGVTNDITSAENIYVEVPTNDVTIIQVYRIIEEEEE